MKIELTQEETEVIKACMTETLARAQVVPYKEAVQVIPIFEGILKAIGKAD